MTTAAPGVPRGFTRQRIARGEGPVPLAFVFDGSPRQSEHRVTVVRWTDAALQLIHDLQEHVATLEPRRSLPTEALRGRLEVADPDNLRLDRGLGLRGRPPTLLWTGCGVDDVDDARARVHGAVLGWLIDDVVAADGTMHDLVHGLKQLMRDGNLVAVERRTAHVFSWAKKRSATEPCADTNPTGYADLADFVARQLEGQEILPGLGGLRRVASGRLDANQAELITEPVSDHAAPFSLVVRVRVLSFPGRATPVVVLEVSRRIWARGLKRATVKELSAYALPDGARTALRFTLRRQRDAIERGTTYSYQPAPDFAPIARAYGLSLGMTGDEIVETGRSLASCRLFVVHKHGVGRRVETRHGVPDLDKMAAFRRTQDVLAPWGFRPWEGLAEIRTGKRAMKDRNQKWRDRDEDEDGREAFERWQEEAKADIAACYDGDHHIVVAYHPRCYGDAERAKALLGELLADHVRAQLIPLPPDVHGPRATLPRSALKAPRARDYAALRTEAWGPFIAEARRYQDDIAARLDGILVIAPEWYRDNGSQAHDDHVNKRAGRIALTRELRVPIQYLRPEEEDGQRFGAGQDPAKKFEMRLMMAWLDLTWKNIGATSSCMVGVIRRVVRLRPACSR